MSRLASIVTELDRWPLARRVAGVAAAVLLGAGLVAFASYPTGTARPDGVVRGGARVAAADRVGDVWVMLVSDQGRLGVVVAYNEGKGWLGVRLAPAPGRGIASYATTPGSGPIPALSAVFGRVDGGPGQVRVRWADGRDQQAMVAVDGTYLVTRPGRVRGHDVRAVDEGGGVLAEVST
jgi:hypothetical protein